MANEPETQVPEPETKPGAPAVQATEAVRHQGKSSAMTYVASTVCGLLGGAAMFFALSATNLNQPKDIPVAVVNLGGLIEAQADGAVTKKDIQAGFKKMQQVGKALAKKGYLVLDASAVIDAPANYYVPKRHTEVHIDNPTVQKAQRPRSERFDTD